MELHSSDAEHSNELANLCIAVDSKPDYVRIPPRKPDPFVPRCLPPRTFTPRSCCNTVYSSCILALSHWHSTHFLPHAAAMRVATFHGLLPAVGYTWEACSTFDDLRNETFPLAARTLFFLYLIKHCPATPMLFRPEPLSLAPYEFTNSVTATFAAAYDFIETVLSKDLEYHSFLSLVLNTRAVDFGMDISEHLVYFPLWADYIYPSLPRTILRPASSEPPPLDPKADLVRRSYTKKPFACPTPGCTKRYKKIGFLRYHLAVGRCVRE